MPFLLSALIVAVPTWFYARLVRNVDRYEREPVKYLIGAFLWGAIPAVIVGIVLELVFAIPVIAILGEGSLAANFINTGIIAPVVEEIIKGLAVAAVYIWRRREFDGWIDGIVYGSTVGFGFAYVENLLYLSQTSTTEEWISLFVLRVLVLGFMHGFWSSLVGIGFGVARGLKHDFAKALVITAGLFAAILGHMFHNGSLALAEVTGGATICVAGFSYVSLIGLMIGLSVVAGRNERGLMQTYLQDEVPTVISQPAFDALRSTSRNARDYLKLLPKSQHDFVHTAAELAIKKKQLAGHPEDTHTAEVVTSLREKLKGYISTDAQEIPKPIDPGPG
jgi:protease PrsW